MKGFFEIGIYHPKCGENIGTLWRSAYQLGALGIFTIGKRYKIQSSDTLKTYKQIPLRHYKDFDDFSDHRPFDVPLIGIEMGGINLSSFSHPKSALYLLGAEDHGLPEFIQEKCQGIISLNAERTESYNVAVAGSIVMYHKLIND